MADLNFPSNPQIGDSFSIGTRTWTWNGVAWVLQTSVVSLDPFTVKRLIVTTTTNSISTSTGAATVEGGVGIGRDLWVGGTIYSNAITATNITVTNTTSATSTTTGALIVTGGLGVGGDLWIGGVLYSGGQAVLTTSSLISGLSQGEDILLTTVAGTGTLIISNSSTFDTVTNRGSTTTHQVTFANTANSTSTTTGAVLISGGVGIAKDLTVGGVVVAEDIFSKEHLHIGNSLYSDFTSPRFSTDTIISLDTIDIREYRTAKYIVQVVDYGYTPQLIHCEELLVSHDDNGDDTQGYIVQYGLLTNYYELGSWDISYSNNILTLLFDPNYDPIDMVIKVNRTMITG